MTAFKLVDVALDVAALRARLDSVAAGAVLCFEGIVRNHNAGRAVMRLAYQAYVELADKEGERILAQARERFALDQIACEHRIGSLKIGDVAVWVGVSAAHRDAAFTACRFVIDEVKLRVPIWKKEFYADGESEWLHP
jgi:molybdopterin synthase catalytic subunit